MEPVSIAVAILGALANSGIVGPILTNLGGMIFGDKGKDVAGKIVDGANKIFGTTDPKSIELAISQDRTKADRFIAQLQEDTKQYQIEVQDRIDARARDLALRQMPQAGTNIRANLMVALAFLYLIGATAFIFFYIEDLSKPGSVAVLTFLTTTMGNVAAMLLQAFNFEFGSSRGSSEKTVQISDLLKKAA